jgi:hypothetical protein
MRRYTVNMLRRERLVDKLVEAYVDCLSTPLRSRCAITSGNSERPARRP